MAFFVNFQPDAMKDITLPDIMLIIGFVLLVGGVSAFDWRLGLIVCGLVLLVGGVVGLLKRVP